MTNRLEQSTTNRSEILAEVLVNSRSNAPRLNPVGVREAAEMLMDAEDIERTKQLIRGINRIVRARLYILADEKEKQDNSGLSPTRSEATTGGKDNARRT